MAFSRIVYWIEWELKNLRISSMAKMFSVHFHAGYQGFPISLNEVKALIRNLKTEVSLWKRITCFPSTLRWRNFKTQPLPVILDLCLRKTRSRKSHDYRDVIVFRKASFSKCFLSTQKRNAAVFRKACSKCSVFVTYFVTEGLTAEIILRFQISAA